MCYQCAEGVGWVFILSAVSWICFNNFLFSSLHPGASCHPCLVGGTSRGRSTFFAQVKRERERERESGTCSLYGAERRVSKTRQEFVMLK